MVEELTRKLNQEHAELSKEELLLIPALNRLKQLFIKFASPFTDLLILLKPPG